MSTRSAGRRPETVDRGDGPSTVSLQPLASSPQPDVRGLVCRHCGCKHFRVIYTRPAWGGRILRRRECRHCGKRVTTWERVGGSA